MRPRTATEEEHVNKFMRILTGALAGLVLAGGLAGGASAAASPTIPSGSKGAIAGGGASFPNDQYQKWITDITAAKSANFGSDSSTKLVLTYTKSSSGTGKANFYGANARGTWMFSGSDSLLDAAQRTSAAAIPGGYIVVPMTAAPVAVITHVSGYSKQILLNAEIICGIYAGDITAWNDAKIVALNPGLSSVSTTIVPVARDATSGTTFIFASYLAKGASSAQRNCSYHSGWDNADTTFTAHSGTIKPADAIMATRFSAMRTAKGAAAIQSKTGNDGIRNYVSATDGTIGYVEMAYSFAADVKTAKIATATKYTSGANKGKPAYLAPTQSGATNAVERQARTLAAAKTAAAKAENDPVNPALTFFQPVLQSGLYTYPIVGFSWLLVYKNYESTVTNAPTLGQVKGLVYFLHWSLTSGAVYKASGVPCFAPLPSSVKARVLTELKLVKYDNAKVWP